MTSLIWGVPPRPIKGCVDSMCFAAATSAASMIENPVDLDLRGRLPLGEAGHRVDGSAGVSHSLAGLCKPRAESSPGLGHELRVMRHPAAHASPHELRHRSLPRLVAKQA